MMGMDDNKDKQLIMDILDVIMKDMGMMGAKKMIPTDVAPMDDAKSGIVDAMKMDEASEGSPEEEATESPKEEEDEDLSSLPRWKQRQRGM